MQTSAFSLAVAITLLGVGCTTIIGLPDLPDALSSGGTAGADGVTSTAGSSELGGVTSTGGVPAGGDESGGSSNGAGATGASANGGSANGGNATGGNSTGGSEQGGTAAAAQCTPKCVTGASCVADACVCPQNQTMCPDACADLSTNKDHCGACATKCDSACSASRCNTQLASLPLGVTQIAVNASHVYFTQQEAGKVSRVPRAGGSVEVLAQTQGRPGSITLDQSNVYWINDSYFTPTVQKLPLVGGDLPQQVAVTSNLDLYSLAVDASYVYWSQDGLAASIIKAPLAGGNLVTLAPAGANNRALAIDATSVYWVDLGDGANTGTVKKVPKAGGTVVTLASGVDSPYAIALYGGSVYFGNSDSIQKVATSGGTVSPLSITTGASSLAVDASGIYAAWAFGKTPPLVQLTLAGAAHATLAKRDNITSVVVDGNSVFWGDGIGVHTTTKAP